MGFEGITWEGAHVRVCPHLISISPFRSNHRIRAFTLLTVEMQRRSDLRRLTRI
jgi:hypothetical protein